MFRWSCPAKLVALLCLFTAISACTEYAVPEDVSVTPVAAQPQTVIRSSAAGVTALNRVKARVEPVAEALCRGENPGLPRKACDFRVEVDRRQGQPPNAFQTLDRTSGQPVLVFNLPLLMSARNDHELAFIMGHEAGHQIAGHIAKSNITANLGALLLGGLMASNSGASQQSVQDAANLGGFLGTRAFSQDYELEADVIATHIAESAGYNPILGAQSFARFTGGGGPLSSHPPSARRLATVKAIAEDIQRQRARGQTPRLPRR